VDPPRSWSRRVASVPAIGAAVAVVTVGKLTASPASGTLAAGQSVRVTITVSGLASLDAQLTVNPGGLLITVLLEIAA
jgi:hypothetical protein